MILFYIFIDFLINMHIICVSMLLQPRSFQSKKKQKDRRFRHFNINFKLVYGSYGLLLLRPIQLTAHQINRLKLFLKRSVKKGDKTRRSF
jgi:ribosomal protein L16/L10AE